MKKKSVLRAAFIGSSIARREDAQEYEAKLVKFYASKYRIDKSNLTPIFETYKKRKGRGRGNRQVLIDSASDARKIKKSIKKFAKENPTAVKPRGFWGHVWNWMTISGPTPPR